MRFRGQKQPPPFLSRRDRARLLWLGLALILVLAAIKVAADPATWVFLFPGERDDATAVPALADVSFDVSLGGEDELEPDEFRSRTMRWQLGGVTSIAQEPEGLVIDRATLGAVEDNTLNLRVSERDAYFTVLSRMREIDDAAIDAAADGNASFPAVMIEPDHYRGRMLSIQGIARRVLEMPAGTNALGFETLYDIWIFTPDSGNNPWRVVATELPSSIPQGVFDDGVPVRCAGVFFKRQGYETQQHDLHVAPLLLAKSVRRVRAPAGAIADFDAAPWGLGAAVVLAVGLAALLIRFRREDRAFEHSTLKRFAAADQPTVAVEETDPVEFFRQLEAAEATSVKHENG